MRHSRRRRYGARRSRRRCLAFAPEAVEFVVPVRLLAGQGVIPPKVIIPKDVITFGEIGGLRGAAIPLPMRVSAKVIIPLALAKMIMPMITFGQRPFPAAAEARFLRPDT
jgi:hypothetical protein